MNMMNMKTNELDYLMETEERIVNSVFDSFKKYWEENADMIVAGLSTLNGGIPFRGFFER